MMLKRIFVYVFALLAIAACGKKDNPVEEDKPKDEGIVVDYNVYKKGATVFGIQNYTKIIVGDLTCPMILASPHDGTMTPSSIPNRDASNPQVVTARDMETTDLIMKVADTLAKLTGLRPHLVINNVSRAKVEPNRALNEAFLRNQLAIDVYNDYHNFLATARKIVSEKVGKGLFIDMHGHGHSKLRTEIGYLLTSSELNNTSPESMNFMASRTSIFGIGKNSSYPFSELIWGDVSLGTIFENSGLKAIPSKQDPKPFDDDYFNGGYCTLTYGSKNDGGPISAIQLETPNATVRQTPATRAAAAGKIARGLILYMKLHYNMDMML